MSTKATRSSRKRQQPPTSMQEGGSLSDSDKESNESLQPGDLFNLLYDDILIVDFRSPASYDAGHVDRAQLFPPGENGFAYVERAHVIAAYFDGPPQTGGLEALNVYLLEHPLRRGVPTPPVRVLAEGYASFADQFPFLTTSDARYVQSAVYPSLVVDNVYQGGEYVAGCRDVLRNLGIRFVLNVTTECKNTFEDDREITYMRIPVQDSATEAVYSHFPDATRFIQNAGPENAVLVHCALGKSRSSTMVLAYLIAHHRMTYARALAHLQTQRPVALPNSGFASQLLMWETESLGDDGSVVFDR